MSLIVSLHTLTAEQVRAIQDAAPGWDIVHGKEQGLAVAKDAEVALGWSKRLLEDWQQADAKLRWIQTWSAGIDYIPLPELAAKQIVLTTASGVHAYPISETIFGMMLALTRKLHFSVRMQSQKEWKDPGQLGEIHGKTIGIIGVGAIGEETARLAKAFQMRVLGLRKSGQPSPYVDQIYDHEGFGELLRQSDFVVDTLPLTDETRDLFGREEFAQMKKSAIFINIGRGKTVNMNDLVDALQNGRIAGAGLDVFDQEPLSTNSPLWEMDNVIITPHNSGSTLHYDERVIQIFLENLRSYLAVGIPCTNIVDYARQY